MTASRIVTDAALAALVVLTGCAGRLVEATASPATRPSDVVRGAGDADGRRQSVLVHAVAVEHGADVVLAIGLHPAATDEADAVGGLLEAIEHRS